MMNRNLMPFVNNFKYLCNKKQGYYLVNSGQVQENQMKDQ